jgi:hypothetical protein
MVCLQCIAPNVFDLLMIIVAVMSTITLAGIIFGIIKIIEYERRRRNRLRFDSEDLPQMEAPMIGAT